METKQSYPTRVLFPRLLRVMKHLLPFIGLAVIFAVLGFVTSVAIPSLLAFSAFSVLEGERPRIFLLFLLVFLALARGGFRYGEHYYGHYVAFHSLANLRKMIFAKLSRLAPAKLDRQDSGALLKMISEDIEALEIFFAHTIAPICTAISTAVLIGIYFAFFSPWLSLVAFFTYFVLAVLIPHQFAKKLQALLPQQNQERKAYVSYFLESLKAMRDLKQFGKAKERLISLTNKSKSVNQMERSVAQMQFLQQAFTFASLGFSIVGFSVVVFFLVGNGHLSLQLATLALVGFSSSFAPFLELGRLPLGFKRAMNAARHVFELLDEDEPNQEGAMSPVSLEEIELKQVSFAYDASEPPIFSDLSHSFSQQKLLGIVGESGSGKSTLVKLIMRWYDIQKGQVLFTEQEAQTINRSHLQASFAYVPQTAQLFHKTLRENIVLGNQTISDDAIWALAERCRLKERLENLPDGLDTIIRPEQDFSAGERQRLELMRALLKDAEVYIFDEPTSNLDSLNEAAFLSIVKEECRGMVFLISHRLSSLAFVDEIYQLEHSKLRRVK